MLSLVIASQTCVTQPCQTARASTAIGPPPARSLPLSCVIGAQAPPDTAVRRRGSHARRGRFGGAGQRAAGGYGCRPSHRRGAVVRARPSPPQLFRGALVRRASSQQPKRAHGRWHRAQPLCWRNCGRTQPHRSRAAREAQGTPRPSPPAQHTRARPCNCGAPRARLTRHVARLLTSAIVRTCCTRTCRFYTRYSTRGRRASGRRW